MTPVYLTSWKEIAGHLGKGVRTVQRWELELGLPVHRPNGSKGVVLASADELDRWIKSTQMHQPSVRSNGHAKAPLSDTYRNFERLARENERLRNECAREMRTCMDMVRKLRSAVGPQMHKPESFAAAASDGAQSISGDD